MTQSSRNTNSNIVRVEVKIRGTRPLWQHKFGPDALPLEAREKTGVAGNDPEEWRRTGMIDAHGRPFVNDTYLFAIIRDGGRYIKKGRGNLVAPISATLQVLDDPIFVDNRFWPGYENGSMSHKSGSTSRPFDIQLADPPPADPSAPLHLDIRGVRNPTTHSRNIRYRVALSPGWEMGFVIQFDKSIVSRDEMHSVLLNAGDLVGLGSGRSIGKGRFKVLSFTELAAKEDREMVSA